MKTYQVKTGDVLISDALVAIAKANAFPADPVLLERGMHYPYLVIDDKSMLCWNIEPFDRHQTVTVAEFIELLKSPLPPPLPPITIGEHEVKFTDEGIAISCTFVPTETVDKIHARLHE